MSTADPRPARFLRRTFRWLLAHPFVTCLLWALFLSALYGVFGPHSFVRIFDNADGGLPARASLNIWLSNGRSLGSWAFGWASGVDRGAIELDGLPFLVLPGWLAYWSVMFGQRLVAAYFSYRLARDRWLLGRAGAWFLALWYSAFVQPDINGALYGWTLYDGLTLAAVPAIAWVLLARDLPRGRFFLAAAATGLLYAWTSGYPFAAFVMILLVVILAASDGRRPITWLGFGAFAAAWAIGEIREILPGILSAAESHRADRSAFTPLTPPLRVQIALALRILRDNIIGLALGLWAFFAGRDRRPRVFVIVALLAAMAAGLARWGDAFLDRYGGPLSALTFERFYFLIPFLAAAAGAFGVNALASSRIRIGRVIAISGLVSVIALAGVLNARMASEMLFGDNYAAVFEDSAYMSLQREAIDPRPFRIATIGSCTPGSDSPQPGFAWAGGLETVDGYVNLYPQRYQDYWEQVIRPLTDQDSKVYGYYHYWGNRIYLFAPSGGFRSLPVDVDRYYDLDLLALANVRYLVSAVELEDERLLEIWRPKDSTEAHPRRVLYAWKFVGGWLAQLTGRAKPNSLYVYELKETLPRAFLASNARSFPDRETLLAALGQATLDELRTTAFVENGDRALMSGEYGTGTASLDISADRMQVEVDSPTNTLLIVTTQYNKYWKAWVDGREAEVMPADCAFMAVHVPAGSQHVDLRYDPPYVLLP